MPNNITIKDANNTNVVLHTIEDSTSVHFNQSIPTDIANNTATVVSGGQAVASGMGALVVAQRDALPAGANLIGSVSISPNGLNIPVSIAQKVRVSVNGGAIVGQNNLDGQGTQSGPFVHNQGSVFNRASNTWDRMTGTSVGLAVIQAGTWNVGLNAGTALVGAVSISPNGLNIPVSLAPPTYNLPVSVHPVTQSGAWNVGLNAGANLIGAVSISPNGLNIPVSVAGTINVATHAVTQSGAWAVSVSDKVSVAGLVGLNAGSNLIGRVSTAGLVSVWDANTVVPDTDAKVWQGFQNSLGVATNYVFNRASNTWDRMTGTSVGLAIVGTVSITGPLPAGTNHLGRVSVEGLSISGVGTQLVSVGGPVSTQGVQIVGRDGLGNARVPYVDASGIARVSIEGSLAVSGSSMTQTVGAAVTTQGYPMLGTDGTNARGLLTTTGGALIVHVSNTAPGGGAGGSSMTQTVGAAVTNQGYPMIGTDGTNARIIRTDTLGRVSLADTFFNVGVNVALPAGTNLIGAVSVSPNGLNIPVSVAGTITVGTHAVTQSGAWTVSVNDKVSVAGLVAATQSGAWNVGLNAGTNLVGAVSISPNGLNIPVSVANTINVNTHAVTQSGAWNVGLNAGTALIGAVSISPNGLNIPVSIANTVNVATHAVTQSGPWNIGAITSINSIVKVSIEGTFAGGGGGSTMTQTVGAAVTNQGYPMLGTDGTNARGLLTTTGGALVVHISNALPAAGASMLQTVGAAVTNQGYPMLGTDGTNARGLLTTTGGALIVHVSNTAPGGGGGGGGGTVMASIGGAVSNQAVQIAGSDTQNNARTIKTNVSGVQFISTRTFMSQYTFARPADTTAYAAGTTAAPGAAGDLIANSTTAGSVIPLKFRVARSSGQNGGVAYIRGARMYRTGGTAAAGQHNITGAIRLHLFNTNNRVSVAGGDNAAMNASPVSNWMGYIDLVAIACAPGLRTSGAVSTQVYWGSPARTGEMLVNLSATQVSIQGLLETRIAFTPISGEIFTVQIEGFNG